MLRLKSNATYSPVATSESEEKYLQLKMHPGSSWTGRFLMSSQWQKLDTYMAPGSRNTWDLRFILSQDELKLTGFVKSDFYLKYGSRYIMKLIGMCASLGSFFKWPLIISDTLSEKDVGPKGKATSFIHYLVYSHRTTPNIIKNCIVRPNEAMKYRLMKTRVGSDAPALEVTSRHQQRCERGERSIETAGGETGPASIGETGRITKELTTEKRTPNLSLNRTEASHKTD